MIIRNRHFDTDHHTYIMGILNTTPDSFSDGGKYNNLDAALFHAEEMINAGADILDIGGESIRPGHTKVTDEEEISRTAPVIEAIRKRFDIPLSIDTYKAEVAAAPWRPGPTWSTISGDLSMIQKCQKPSRNPAHPAA